MAASRLPTPDEIAELVAFLPRICAEGFKPVARWHGGVSDEDGVLTFPWPEYSRTAEEFFAVAGRAVWSDYAYRPEDTARMLADESLVRSASLAQVKSMLTYCVRGERFCDGHWAAMLEQGYVRRLLERLAALQVP